MSSLEEAQKVTDLGSTASSGSKSALGSNFVVNILMAGSLTQVWAMIEGLQIVVHMPLFKIKSPGNVNAFIDFSAELANFNVIDTSKFT